MKIEVEALSPVEKKLTVEVDPQQVARELDRAYSSLGRRVKLRGFRAGKVPRNVLERHFRDEVEKEVVQRLISTGFDDALREQDIPAVAPPRVDLATPGLQPAQPFRFTARVEVKPRLEPRDYRGLTVTRRKVEVTEEQVSAELARIQDSLATLVKVEGREEAQEGDYATIDHDGTVGGQPFLGCKAEGVTVRVGAGELSQGYLPQLAGRRIGEIFELEQAVPDTYRAPELRGKTALMRVTLQALKTRQLPALDDAFAKGLGLQHVETLEQLRADIREELEKRDRERAEAEVTENLVKAALAKNDFEVPPALVERAIDLIIDGAQQRFARQGIDMGEVGLDMPRLRADLRERAVGQVKSALLMEAIADVEKLDPSEEEMQAEIARAATEAHEPLAKMQMEFSGGEGRRALWSKLREKKALALLTSEAKVE